MPACSTWLPLLALVLPSLCGGCGRLPVVAIAGRLRVASDERGAAQSSALVIGCAFELERDARARAVQADDDDRAATVAALASALPEARCADAMLCAWQRDAELGASRILLPIADAEEIR